MRRRMLLAIAAQLLRAVDFLHSADICHGSISAGSVLVRSEPANHLMITVQLDVVPAHTPILGVSKCSPFIMEGLSSLRGHISAPRQNPFGSLSFLLAGDVDR